MASNYSGRSKTEMSFGFGTFKLKVTPVQYRKRSAISLYFMMQINNVFPRSFLLVVRDVFHRSSGMGIIEFMMSILDSITMTLSFAWAR